MMAVCVGWRLAGGVLGVALGWACAWGGACLGVCLGWRLAGRVLGVALGWACAWGWAWKAVCLGPGKELQEAWGTVTTNKADASTHLYIKPAPAGGITAHRSTGSDLVIHYCVIEKKDPKQNHLNFETRHGSKLQHNSEEDQIEHGSAAFTKDEEIDTKRLLLEMHNSLHHIDGKLHTLTTLLDLMKTCTDKHDDRLEEVDNKLHGGKQQTLTG
ncbi:hypothetical protein NDU88_005256 [Pleurodeles waltl]|uniref:Uncharacterized protein n=1 Tax=Pleurodeles waltl TaxID=8319 RepID=A0AAV7NNG1_PLEWA|nr:hypothetical protein NDU88_005256 [Pleurodeles waltl]